MKTQVNIKLDTAVKKDAQKRAKALGLSLSAVVNAVLAQFARTGELTLTSAPRITPYLEELVALARREYVNGKVEGPFTNADDMIKSLEA